MTNRPEIRRVRHDTRSRRLTVKQVQHLTPKMLRITVAGEDLAGFTSLGFDDHVKVFFPTESGELVMPTRGPNGPEFAAGAPRPPMRDYTPRRFDAATNSLLLDFVIHDAGPATNWASQARPGQILGVGGPRGSFVIPTQFDWHLLVGDETALPAIGRRLEELPRETRALVVVEIDGPGEEQKLESAVPFEVLWVHRNGGPAGDPNLLLERLRSVTFPKGEYYAWIAGETQVARALRQYLLAERSTNKEWLKAAGYWRRGAVGAHERIED